MRQSARKFGLVLLFLASCGLSFAQNNTATMLGTVTDSSGGAIAGAGLEIRNTDTGQARKVATDGKGDFTAPNLVAGPYEVVISKEGFRSARETGIILQIEQI